MRNFLILILVSLTLFACNPVKRVLKSEAMTQQVVDSFIKNHPVTNDTITTYIQGKTDTLTQFQTFRDTIKEKVPCDTFTKKTDNGTTVKVDTKGQLTIENDSIKTFVSVRVDTLNTLIKDRTLLIQAQDLVRKQAAIISAKEQEAAECKQTIKGLEKNIFWLKVKMWSLLGLLIAVVGFVIYDKVKSFFT